MNSNGSVPGALAYGAGWFLVAADEAEGAGLAAVAFAEHGGGMPGTTAYFVVREDGLVIAAALNTNHGESPLNSLALELHRVLARVPDWPEEDLFTRFP